jgi:hypothetical protein
MLQITKIVQPETGAVMLVHCADCRRTEIYVSPFALKPGDGDAWKIELPCPVHTREVLTFALNGLAATPLFQEL